MAAVIIHIVFVCVGEDFLSVVYLLECELYQLVVMGIENMLRKVFVSVREVFMSALEVFVLAREVCVSAREVSVLAREVFVSAREVCVSARESL